jgi:hypothetical protein
MMDVLLITLPITRMTIILHYQGTYSSSIKEYTNSNEACTLDSSSITRMTILFHYHGTYYPQQGLYYSNLACMQARHSITMMAISLVDSCWKIKGLDDNNGFSTTPTKHAFYMHSRSRRWLYSFTIRAHTTATKHAKLDTRSRWWL